MFSMTRTLRSVALAATALLPLGLGFAIAGPKGGTVVGGSATISGQGSGNVVVDQWSNRAIINWNTFNIGTGETTRFNQPDSSSVVLNRVTGGLGPSEIFGTLSANGRVFLINRDGILFGSNAVVNTAGFLATTSDIKNEDFMAGRYNFNIPGRPDASIVNHGIITAHNSGFAALVAPGVRNTGTITATLGTVGLAAGNSFTLDLYGDKLITLAVGDQIAGQVLDVQTQQPLRSLVENTGALRANGGRVELTAAAARQVVDSVINTSGVVEANTIGEKNGTIVLGAATADTLPANTPQQTVRVSGTLSASGKNGGKGGKVIATGQNVELRSADVDVSGRDGGGTALIGGDWGGGHPNTDAVSHPRAKLENQKIANASTVSVDSTSTINASATGSGAGGKVVLWSDQSTAFSGTITATGSGGGQGGFVETSGKTINVSGTIDAGLRGLWLLDPNDLTINTDLAATISKTLSGGTDVTQFTSLFEKGGNGDLFVNSAINWTGPAILTLEANRNIAINAPITGASGGFVLSAAFITGDPNAAITANAAVNVGTFTLNGGNWRQVGSELPTFAAADFRIQSGSFLRALGGDGSSASPYQITDVYGLQGMGSSSTLAANSFVLANSIDARSTANWNGGAGF